MAGITDAAFRHIAIEQGADFTYTEMVSAKGLKYGNARTASLLSFAQNEKSIGVQLFSSDADALKASIDSLQEHHFERIALFDINMGCPAPKITSNGEGCALMKNAKLASQLIKAAADISKKPVTVKFRKGWDEQTVNAVDFARMAEQSGAAAVTVHGRTRSQFYSGHADLDIIAEVKRSIRIPVTGNGDIFCAQDALNMLKVTGCDSVMVARGAMGNPFLFREIKHLMHFGTEMKSASTHEKLDALIKQAKLACADKSERIAMKQIRKHAAWYFKGMNGAAKLREAAVRLITLDDLYTLIASLPEHPFA
jgi:tRNA-dihydrouridine synthase B